MKKQNKRILRITLLVATLISMFFVPWILVRALITPLPETVQEEMQHAIDYGFDGMIVYIDQAGKAPQFFAAGWKNRENQIPADPHALFKIASVGKLYKAVAISKLVHDGQLSLDKTLADYLPELKDRIANADKITLKMMVQHKSGIPNYTDTKNYWMAPKENDDEKLALILDMPANFAPGEDYEYSNTNYLLIGRIMDRVLDYDSFQYIQKEILTPLHLNHTYASIHDVNLDDVMSGYYVGYDADLKTQDIGSMLATAEDVGIFLRALNDGSVFKDKDEEDIYASIYKYAHTGWVPGYQSIAKYHKDLDAVVIQLNNTTGKYNWNTAEIVYHRIVKILKRSKNS